MLTLMASPLISGYFSAASAWHAEQASTDDAIDRMASPPKCFLCVKQVISKFDVVYIPFSVG